MDRITYQQKILITKLDISILQTQIENLSKKNKDMAVMSPEQQKGNASGIKEQKVKNSRKQNDNPYTQVTEKR